MAQQNGNDRLGSEVLNCWTEFEQERDFRTVGINSVTHDTHNTRSLPVLRQRLQQETSKI